MYSYDIEAKNARGNTVFVYVKAESKAQAAEIVERMGYAPRSVNKNHANEILFWILLLCTPPLFFILAAIA